MPQILEDDCYLTPAHATQLRIDVLALEKAHVHWDIWLLNRTSQDAPAGFLVGGGCNAEERSVPGAPPKMKLVYPTGNSGTGSYLLTKQSAARLAAAGLQTSLFNLDDFLSAVTFGHFRPDVMGHPAVRAFLTRQGGLVAIGGVRGTHRVYVTRAAAWSDTEQTDHLSLQL